MLPDTGGAWRVRLSDRDTGNVLFDIELWSGHVNSSKRYFVPFRLEVWSHDECVLCHDYDAADRDVLIRFPVGTIGDVIGWIGYAVKFKQRHRCRLTCAMGEALIPLFRAAYPDISFIAHEQVQAERYYATYSVALFFDDSDLVFQPCDFRQVGLHRTAAYILGVDPAERPPSVALADDSRPIAEPYVCIAVQATTQCKHWNNPDGWDSIIAFLKATGYRVICIDQKADHSRDGFRNQIPSQAEDQTGDRPLQERARWLKHCAFFIGLSSGLSWLAWAVGAPVVLISGFTHPINEFATPYRVINYHACNGCWNDAGHRFDHSDFLWCPRLKDTPRRFECTRLITAKQVEATIRSIPGFGEGLPPRTEAQIPADQASGIAAAAPRQRDLRHPEPTTAPLAGSADQSLAVSALLEQRRGDVHGGGLAVGITVGAGKRLTHATDRITEGDGRARIGDLVTALQMYMQGAADVRLLTEADPNNTVFQRNLSIALNRIGAILFVQRDLEHAEATYRASLAIAQRLNAAQPDNPTFRRELAWCHALMAEVLTALGRHHDAFEQRRANAGLTTQIAAASPEDPLLQRALAVSYQCLGDALVPLGNFDGALAAYRVSLGLVQRGLAAKADDPAWTKLYDPLLQKIRAALVVQRQAATS